ncbi:hypothetical protein RB623_19735 [Mesorhizobium sp. LHD-90]|uniref:hypothetical protein n=1 Tax=Mesorhizobium sp. LHD-90 TaxID=3071414 RepID=UPI0027E119BC|nr:hypothetical protein [Mesorhizobium sp. LHD-90]MDQ6436296.1 hypothetical protein [Mesorhizobium sp. LHD-90]
MRDDWRANHNPLPPPDGSEDRPDGFSSVAILVFVAVAPLIYFGPQLGAFEAWLVDIFRRVDGWAAPIREFFLG